MCGQRITLTPRQRRVLEALPDPGGPVSPVLTCLRHAHHRGSHLADGVEAVHTERVRWIRWGRYLWRIFDAGYCGARSDRIESVHPELDFCHLRRRHRGPHSTDYLPADVRWWEQGQFALSDDYQHQPREGG